MASGALSSLDSTTPKSKYVRTRQTTLLHTELFMYQAGIQSCMIGRLRVGVSDGRCICLVKHTERPMISTRGTQNRLTGSATAQLRAFFPQTDKCRAGSVSVFLCFFCFFYYFFCSYVSHLNVWYCPVRWVSRLPQVVVKLAALGLALIAASAFTQRYGSRFPPWMRRSATILITSFAVVYSVYLLLAHTK